MKKYTLTKNTIIHCKTRKDWIKVCKKIEKDYPDVRWHDGEKPTEFENWSEDKKDSCIEIDDNQLSYNNKKWYQENQPEDPIITSQKFLGEPIEEEEFVDSEWLEEKQAINLLKSKGYKVIKEL